MYNSEKSEITSKGWANDSSDQTLYKFWLAVKVQPTPQS